MGLLDALLSNNSGGGLFDSLFYPTSAPDAGAEKKKQDAAFLAAIGQDPYQGVSNPTATPMFQASGGGFPINNLGPTNIPALAGTNAGAYGGSSPFGLGGFNLPVASQGAPASGAFPAVPFMQPQAPQAAAPQMAPTPPPQMAAPAPQNGPSGSINVGSNYQMPQVGNRADYTPQQPQATDFSAQSRQPQPEQLPPAFGNSGQSFLDKLNTGFQSIGNGGSILGVLSGNRTDPQSMAQQNLRAEYEATRQALIGNGTDPNQASRVAMLAVMNKDAGKVVLPELLSNKEKYGVVSDNPIEGKKYGFVNERDQTINGKPIGQGGAGQQDSVGLLAPGVQQYNPNLSGDAYLGQFSPEVQAATKAYIKGDVMPSGNPRQQGIASQAKTIAQKYAADMGIPVSDALYAEKRKYRTELGSNSPNTAGGQAKAFNQGMSHLTTLADTLEKLDNSNGLGIPMVAQGVNMVRQGASNSQAAIADQAQTLGQTVAGEVGKLFSGSAGGGVHERELTRERFDTVKSKPQLAAALKATVETMQGGLDALEANRDRILGPDSGVNLVSDATRANIAKIQGVISRLEGKSSASNGIPSGWSVKER